MSREYKVEDVFAYSIQSQHMNKVPYVSDVDFQCHGM